MVGLLPQTTVQAYLARNLTRFSSSARTPWWQTLTLAGCRPDALLYIYFQHWIKKECWLIGILWTELDITLGKNWQGFTLASSWIPIQESSRTYQELLEIHNSVYWINFLKKQSGSSHGKGRILLDEVFCFLISILDILAVAFTFLATVIGVLWIGQQDERWGTTLISDIGLFLSKTFCSTPG